MKTPMPFKTIIVGVDFSEYSKVVVKQARLLSTIYSLPLVFVHAVGTPNLMAGDISYLDLDDDLLTPTLQEVISFYKLSAKSQVIVKLGRASDEILSIAQKFKAPLIVIGHKGESTALGRFFIGSTAEELGLRSPFPVWMHRGKNVRAPKNILLPCDFSKGTKKALKISGFLKGCTKPNYEFFHVQEPLVPVLDASQWKRTTAAHRKRDQAGEALLHKLYPLIPLKIKRGIPAKLITKESENFDLIAMAPRGRGGIFSTFGSVTAKVLRSGATPVLITR